MEQVSTFNIVPIITIGLIIALAAIAFILVRKMNCKQGVSKVLPICALISGLLSSVGSELVSLIAYGMLIQYFFDQFNPYKMNFNGLSLGFLIAIGFCSVLCLYAMRKPVIMYIAICVYGVALYFGLSNILREIYLSLNHNLATSAMDSWRWWTFDFGLCIVSLLLLLIYLNNVYSAFTKDKIAEADVKRKKLVPISCYALTLIAFGTLAWIVFYEYNLYWGRSSLVIRNIQPIIFVLLAIFANIVFIITEKLPMAVFPIVTLITCIGPRIDRKAQVYWYIVIGCIAVTALILIAEQFIKIYHHPQQGTGGSMNKNGKYTYLEQYRSQMHK